MSAAIDFEPLTLIPDDNWQQWFREVGITDPRPTFSQVEYPSQEMAAAAALEGSVVALLSPALFAPLAGAGKLMQPFRHATGAGEAYHVLVHEQDNRLSVDHVVRCR